MKGRTIHKTIWCDRGWMPVYYAFCSSEMAWHAELKRLKAEPTPYPAGDANTSRFRDIPGQAKLLVVVTVAEAIDRKKDTIGVMALLAHEAAHVWQAIREDIGEDSPSHEFEAYAIQNIFASLADAYSKTRQKIK